MGNPPDENKRLLSILSTTKEIILIWIITWSQFDFIDSTRQFDSKTVKDFKLTDFICHIN